MIASAIARGLSRVRNFGQVTPDDPIRFMRYLPVPQLPAGLNLTMDMALQLSVVWACIDAIAKAIAASHWHVYKVKGTSFQYLPDDPLEYLLNVRPNPEMGALGWKEAMLFGALSWGNGYSEIVPNGRGEPTELWPLLAERMIPRRWPAEGGPDGQPPYTLYYEYHQLDGGVRDLPQERVYHIRGPSITGLMGENMIARAAKAIALDAAMERFGLSYFANNTIIGGYLEYPKTLEPEAKRRLEGEWNEKHANPSKAFGAVVLENGMKWVPQNNDAEKSQLLESRKFQVEEICRWYGVPPHKVAHLERATFNNIEHLNLEFTQTALVPWARRMEQEADHKLFSSRGQRRQTKIDLGWLSHGDAKSRWEAHQIARNIGVKSANDILREEGANEIGPEGDVRIVPLNFTTIEGLQKQVEQIGKQPPAPPGGKKGPPGDGEGDQEGGSAGAGPGGDSTGDGATTNKRRSLVKDSVVTLFASAFDRYQKRLDSRAKDLARNQLPAAKVAENLAQEKERLKPKLLQECAVAAGLTTRAAGRDVALPESVYEIRILQSADAVDSGLAPHVVAERLFDSLLQEAT